MTRTLIRPPGSGKGTQAELISGRLGAVAISTGDIFRGKAKGRTARDGSRKYMAAIDSV